MKRLLFTIISLFAFVFIGCEKEETISFGDNGKLIATIENSAITKASLNENENDNSLNVVWQANDSIAVLYKKGDGTILNTVYRLESGTGTTEGVFALSKRNSQPSIPDITGATMVAAVYPCNWDATYDESTNTITGVKLPASYNLNIIGTTTKAPMAYIGSEGKVLFKNVGALVKVAVSNVPSSYNSVELSSATSKLSGSYKISFDNNGVPVASMTDDAANGNSVTFVVSDANRSFYFPILPGTYTDLTVKTKGESVEPIVLIAPKALTAARSNYYNTETSLTNVSNQSELTSAITGAGTDINVKVDDELNSVSLPSTNADKTVTLAFSSETENITVTQADGETVAGNVNIIANTANNVDNRELSITLPNSTVEVSGNSTYANITASTADNTLILGKGVTANKVTVVKGNIKVNEGASLENIVFGNGVTTVVVIDNGGNIADEVKSKQGVTVMSGAEYELKKLIKNATEGSIIQLKENIEIINALTINKDLTIDMAGYTITSAGDGFEATAGTLTITGNGTMNAASDGQWVAIWANGGNVVVENGTFSVGDDANGNTNDCVYAKGGTITINGGNFSNAGTYDASKGGVVINANNDIANSKVIINAGTFNPAQGCVIYEDKDRNSGKVIWNIAPTTEAELNAAIAAAQDGSTITLGDNISMSGSVVVNKNLTIDMAGYTITSAGDGFEATAGTLTITGNGTMNAASDGQWVAIWANGGNVVVENGTFSVGDDANGNTNDCVYAKGGTITINGGNFSNAGTYDASKGGVVINANNDIANSKVIINAGTFNPAQGCVIYEDKDRNSGKVIWNIAPTTEAELNAAIAAAQDGSTITLGDNISMSGSVVVNKNLTIDMAGYTITSAGDGFEATAGTLTITGNGTMNAASDGQWVAIWANGGNVVVENGTFSVGDDANGNTNDCVYAKGGTITINGGNFSNAGTYDASKGGVVINANNDIANSKVIINAGTFNPAQGCVIYEDKDRNSGKVIWNIAPTTEAELNAAIAAAQDGSTITLGDNISMSGSVVVNKNLTIDMAGYTITSAGDGFEATAGTLTITGNGTMNAASDGQWVAIWANGGNVVVENGTFSVGDDANGNTNDCVYAKGGTITINGGNFSNAGTYDASKGGVVINANNDIANSKVIINAGTFNPAQGCVEYEEKDITAGRIEDKRN